MSRAGAMLIAVMPGAKSWGGVGVLLLVVGAAVLVGLVLHTVVAWLVERVSRRAASPVGTSLAVHARAPAQVVFVLAAVQIVLLGLREPRGALEPMRHIVALALIAAAAWLVVRLTRVVDWGVEAYFRDGEADPLRARRVQTRVRVIHRVIAGTVWVVWPRRAC